MTPDEFTDMILGYPVKWVDTMPSSNCTGPPIVLGPIIPLGYEVDAETSDGRKFKIKVRFVTDPPEEFI